MRWLPSLLAVIAVSHGQYGLSEDATTAPDRPAFDCTGRDDGNYAAVECTSEYFACSSGIAYLSPCPDQLTFDSKKNKCVYPNECGVEEVASTTTEAVTTTTQRATTTTTETVYISKIDCSMAVNGYFSEGCTPSYTFCSYGVPTIVDCEPGTLFDTMTGHCEPAHECGKIRTTLPPATSAVPSAYPIPTTTNVNDSPFDCQNKVDGAYSLGCQDEFVDCSNGVAFTKKCPANLVFNEFLMRCDYECVPPATTQPQDTTATTSVYSTYSTSMPSSTTSTEVPTTTEAPTTSASYVPTVTTTIAAPSVCQSGQVSSLGDCSSKFRRCRCGQWKSAVCPGSSVFDQLTGLCLYSVPRCYTDIVPGKQVTVPTDNVYATPTQGYAPDVNQNVAEAPYMPMWDSEQLLSNPFYTHTRHRSHRKSGRRSDSGRQYKGKIHAKPKSVRVDDRTSYVTDNFRGSYEPYVHSSSWSTFPRSRVHRMRMHTAMRTQSDDDETELLDPEVEVTETQDNEKVTLPFASAAVAEFEGSGDMLMPEKENAASRDKRSYGFAPPGGASNDANGFCRGVATNSLVSLGACRQEFVVCRSNSASVAACPVDDLFDDNKKACVPADLCGVPGADMCAAPLSPVYPEPVLEQTATSTPLTPVRHCSQGFSGVISTGCSRSYVMCDNGIEFTMNCQEGLFYNKERSVCDYRHIVVECGGSGEPKVSSTSIPIDVATTRSSVPAYSSATSAPSGEICPSPGNGYVPASQCSKTYYHCVEGQIKQKQVCPEDLIFDVSKNLCDYPASVPGCVGAVVDTTGYNDGTSREQSTPAVPTLITTSQPSTIRENCIDAPNGLASAGPCSEQYLVCIDGKVVSTLTCYDGRVFDEKKKTCVSRKSVSGCGVAYPEVSPIGREEPSGSYVIRTTTSKPITNIIGTCDGAPNGSIPTGSCSGSFLNCQGGRVLAKMSCPSDLVFDGNKDQCVHRHELASCSGYSVPIVVPTDNSPVEQQSVYTTSAPISTATVDIVHRYEELPVEGTVCAAAVRAEGMCSPNYITCDHGTEYNMKCSEPLVFSDAEKSCVSKEHVAGCDESTTAATTIAVEPVTEALQENTTPTTTYAPESSSLAMAYGQPVQQQQCTYTKDHNIHSLGFCSNQYFVCTPEGVLETVSCNLGQLFDSASLLCVSSAECGRPKQIEPITTTTTVAPLDDRCDSLPRRTGSVAINNCSSQYLRCNDGVSATAECPFKLVFSPSRGICLRRHNVYECRSNIVYVSVSTEHDKFCVGRENRLYRDPKNCAGIIHCHGGEMFTQVGCSSGLVFNEQKQSCDYRQNVDGCEEKLQKPQKDTGCNGAEHGAYIPDDADCSIFYRCVWNRLERMNCPTGTVFNPTLSVCDWPSAVPKCAAKNSANKQHSSTTHNELSRPY